MRTHWDQNMLVRRRSILDREYRLRICFEAESKAHTMLHTPSGLIPPQIVRW